GTLMDAPRADRAARPVGARRRSDSTPTQGQRTTTSNRRHVAIAAPSDIGRCERPRTTRWPDRTEGVGRGHPRGSHRRPIWPMTGAKEHLEWDHGRLALPVTATPRTGGGPNRHAVVQP